MLYIELSVFLVRRHVDVFFFKLYFINMIKHHHADHPSDTFAVKANCGSKLWREKVRVTEKQFISAHSRIIVNKYPMTKINQFITVGLHYQS